METNKQEMEIMHIICQKELQELQLNLSKYLLDSERVQKILCGRKSVMKNDGIVPSSGGGGDSAAESNIFALIAFDRYMSQVSTVLNMARKFNIHLELNKLTNAIINPAANNSVAQSRVLQDYIEWSNARLERDVTSESGTNEAKEVESLSWKKDSLLKFSQDDGIFKKNTLGSSQNLYQIVNDVKNVERSIQDNPHDIMAKLDNILKVILPTKDLSHFKEGYKFSASITYVQDYKDLVFFICEMNDYKILYELCHAENLTPTSLSTPSDAVFYISQNKIDNAGEKDWAWRAVMVPEEGNDVPDSAYLIDFGEIIPLTNQCKFYRVPLEYMHISPLAIKCTLKGIHDGQTKLTNRDHAECEQVLRSGEYKMAQFRVVQQQNRFLHLVLVEKTSNEISRQHNVTQSCKTLCKINNNPFLNASLSFDKDDEENSNNNLDSFPKTSSSMSILPTTPSLNVTAQIGDKLKILVTHIVNPITFYAIIEEDSYDHSKALSWPDHEIAMLTKQMSPPQINDIVLAQYIKDGYWYRARVIGVHEKDLYKVFYVDFGNTEIVPLCCLAKCCKPHLEEPLRAVLFRMANISIPMDNGKTDGTSMAIDVSLQKATETMVVLMLDQTLNVEVVDRHKEELVVLLIDQQFADLPKILIDMGVVKEV